MRYKTKHERYVCSSCGPFTIVVTNPPTDSDIHAEIKKHFASRQHRALVATLAMVNAK